MFDYTLATYEILEGLREPIWKWLEEPDAHSNLQD